MRAVVVAIGSNSGDRAAHIRRAVLGLSAFLERLQVAPSLETPPEPPADPLDPPYLNTVAVGASALPPEDLLDRLLAIEARAGRTRPHPGSPRTVDLDLVLCGNLVVATPRLTLPHPRFRERRFVLAPLALVAPGLRDPVTGLTIRQLLDRLEAPPPVHS